MMREFLRAGSIVGASMAATPLQPAPSLSERYGLSLHTKHENLTPVRSFKLRGALNRIAQLSAQEREAGVVTASTGNHGLAIAHAAAALGTSAVIVVPPGVPDIKTAPAVALGAELRAGGPTLSDAIATAAEIGAREQRVVIEDGDDSGLMFGAGTIALEVVLALPHVDVMLVPVGGGNLIAGIASCARQLSPEIEIVGVQSTSAPAVYESFRAKEVVTLPCTTFAGGLATEYPGRLALERILGSVHDIVLVTDDELRAAMALAIGELGQVLEGAGAASIAALERYADRWRGRTVVAILSGGNADRAEVLSVLQGAAPAAVGM